MASPTSSRVPNTTGLTTPLHKWIMGTQDSLQAFGKVFQATSPLCSYGAMATPISLKETCITGLTVIPARSILDILNRCFIGGEFSVNREFFPFFELD